MRSPEVEVARGSSSRRSRAGRVANGRVAESAEGSPATSGTVPPLPLRVAGPVRPDLAARCQAAMSADDPRQVTTDLARGADLALTHNTDYRDIVDAAFLQRVLED